MIPFVCARGMAASACVRAMKFSKCGINRDQVVEYVRAKIGISEINPFSLVAGKGGYQWLHDAVPHATTPCVFLSHCVYTAVLCDRNVLRWRNIHNKNRR